MAFEVVPNVFLEESVSPFSLEKRGAGQIGFKNYFPLSFLKERGNGGSKNVNLRRSKYGVRTCIV
jgi:hypothetical protein